MKSASVETPWPAGSLELPANETSADRRLDLRTGLLSITTLIGLSVTGLAFVASVSVSLAADSAKKNQEPPVVDPDHMGGPPSEALARFRGERRPKPKWTLANGLAETTPGSGLNRKRPC